jgi:hypothetical protein
MDDAGVKYLPEPGLRVPAVLPTGTYVGEVTITECRPLAWYSITVRARARAAEARAGSVGEK